MKNQTLILAAALALSGAAAGSGGAYAATQSSQPVDERKAQESLPMSHDGVWNTLLKAKIAYSDKEPHITAKIPPEVKSLGGKTLELSGFVLPMDSEEKTSHFLLSKRTPTCPFCPPGEPNEVVEVYSKKPVKWDANLLTMRGTFTLTNNTDQGIFFVLKDSAPVANATSYAMPLFSNPNTASNNPVY